MTPTVAACIDEALAYLSSLKVNVSIPLKYIWGRVLDDERFYNGYGAAVGGRHGHHAYPGGLFLHTYEVVCNCRVLTLATTFEKLINLDVLLTSAVCHDFKKIDDYDAQGAKTQYRQLVRHLSGSHAQFVLWAKEYGLDEETTMQIEHCILAHHGRHEWESPVLPQTPEASILHYADMLSMQYGKFVQEPK